MGWRKKGLMYHSHDNPPKNRMRDAWMSFLPESLDHARPARGPLRPIGLYLPSWENLELPGYLAKGIAPSQLVGAERDLDRLPEVIERAQGIRLIAGSVLEAAEILMLEKSPRLWFANVDLEGGYDSHAAEILSLFRLLPPNGDDAAHLAVTSYAARAHGIANGIEHASKFASGIDDLDQVVTQLGIMERRYAIIAGMLSCAEAKPITHLCRELGFLWWLVIGMGLMDGSGSAYGTYDSSYLRDTISPGIRRIRDTLKDARATKTFRLARDRELAEALGRRTVTMWPTAFRHFLYYSPQHQPMQTWFVRFYAVDHADGRTVQDLLRQVWDLAFRTPLTYISSEGMEVTINNP